MIKSIYQLRIIRNTRLIKIILRFQKAWSKMYPHLCKLKNSSKKRKKNLETSLISSKCHLYHIKNRRLFSQYNVLKERRYIFCSIFIKSQSLSKNWYNLKSSHFNYTIYMNEFLQFMDKYEKVELFAIS